MPLRSASRANTNATSGFQQQRTMEPPVGVLGRLCTPGNVRAVSLRSLLRSAEEGDGRESASCPVPPFPAPAPPSPFPAFASARLLPRKHLLLGARKHGQDAEADRLAGQCGRPAVVQDAEADVPVAVDVRVDRDVVNEDDLWNRASRVGGGLAGRWTRARRHCATACVPRGSPSGTFQET